MLIEAIHISDWRNIEETSAELAALTIIRGHNHQGKSSVAQAIQIPLTTRAEGTDAQGRGANDKIRLGAKKARIGLTIKGKNGSMPFEVTYGPGRTGRQITSENPPAFLKWLEINNERLSCALDSEYFIRQKAEDQKSILASLVLPQSFEFPESYKLLADKYLMNPVPAGFSWTNRPIQIIDALYDRAFEERKTAKANLAANHIPQLPPNRPTQSVAQVREKLQQLRDQAKQLLDERPQIDTEALQQTIDEGTEVGGRLFRAEAEAGETRTAIGEAESNILAPAALKTYEKIANQRKFFDSLQAQINAILQQIEDQRTVVAVWRDLLEQKKCPTCSQSITEAFVNERIAEAEQIIKNQGVKQNSLMRDQRELGNIDEAEHLVAAHKESLGTKDTLQRQLADEIALVSNLKEKQRELKAKVEAARGALQATNEPSPELYAMNTEIGKWEGMLEASVRYDALVQQISEASERARQITAKVEDLEKLCKYFGKDGVKAQLIQQNIEAFESTVNWVLSVWGYKAKLSIEPYAFDVTTQEGRTLPLKELSGSEKLMFAVALQTAIAHHSKIGMVLVDKADVFINSQRGRLFQALGTLLQQHLLDQAIVMVADDRTEVPQKDGVVFYAAQAGKLVKL